MIRLVPIRPMRLFDKGRRPHFHPLRGAHPLRGSFYKFALAGLDGLVHSIHRRTGFLHGKKSAVFYGSAGTADAVLLQCCATAARGSSRQAPLGEFMPVSRPQEERRRLAELPGPAFRRGRSPPPVRVENPVYIVWQRRRITHYVIEQRRI